MNLLLNFISIIIKNLWESVAVIDHNKEWKYKDIDEYSDKFSKSFLQYTYKIHVALYARNSIEWIIAFLAILKSKNKILLIHPSISIRTIERIVNEQEIDVVVTDNEILLSKSKCNTININNSTSSKYWYKSILFKNAKLEGITSKIQEEDSLQVLSFRSLRIITISFSTILSLIQRLKDKGLFSNKLRENYYVAHVDFTYNYIIGFLLPFSQNVPIIIPQNTALFASVLYHPTNTVILTARKFEVIYHMYIDISTDVWIKFLKEIGWEYIINLIYKYRLKKLFGNIETLVILNSDLNHQIERTLKAVKFPYTITYGLVETGGIVSYSPPKEFKMWTMGQQIYPNVDILPNTKKILIGGLSGIIIEDVVSKDSKGNITFHNREEDEIISSHGFISYPNDAERKLKSLPLIDDCLLVQQEDNSLCLYVSLDTDYIEVNKIGVNLTLQKRNKVIHDAIQKQIDYINNHLEMGLQITNVIVLPYDFEYRDHYDRIRRDMYSESYIKSGLAACNQFLSR